MKQLDKIAIPWMGSEYTLIIQKNLKSLGLNVVLCPKISEKTIRIGVKNTAVMMCYPFKVTLGNFVESLDEGANILFMFDSCGQCRQKHYFKLHEFTLKKMGYKNFKMYPINLKTMILTFKKLSGKSYFTVIMAIKRAFKEIKKVDKEKYKLIPGKINIGIIGEIYTTCEERINYDMENKLKKLGANPYNTASLSEFLDDTIYYNRIFSFLDFSGKRKHRIKAKKYFNKKLGGHGIENIYNLLWLKDKGIDGIIHLLPLSCMPESTIEPIINDICQKGNIPLIRFPIDETNSEANVDTRLETFVELIRRKKVKQDGLLARS